MTLLSVKNISSGYGKKQILFDISFKVGEGESVLLVGSNGSGKSTLFKAIYGLIPLWSSENKGGQIYFKGENITNTKSYELIQKGLMYIPQKNELYGDMTVRDNLKMSLLHTNHLGKNRSLVDEIFDQIPVLKEKSKQSAGSLSGGERKLLSLGMVLLNKPKLLLFDEPLAGLSGNNIGKVIGWLEEVKKNGTSIILIEHRIKEVFNFAEKKYGLKLGHLYSNLTDIDNIKKFLV